jgi:putative ABC transport system substrate-binding protein
VRRRELLAGLAGAIALPLAAEAQQKTIPVIGWLGIALSDDPAVVANLAGFRLGLSDTDYVEGQNVRIEYRSAENHYDRLPALAADLVSRRVDVIVNEGGSTSALAAKQATSTIPIVFNCGDAVAEGLVASLAHPGGNLTGVSQLAPEIWPKLLQMAFELVPKARVVALLVNPDNPQAEHQIRVLQEAAATMNLQVSVLKAGSLSELDSTFASLDQPRTDALIVLPDIFLVSHRDQLVALAARHAVPAVYGQRTFATAGGLLAYQPNQPAVYRIKGVYAGKILSGVQPADLPVQQPTAFDLAINLKTAKTLGLTVPPYLLAQADEIIE